MPILMKHQIVRITDVMLQAGGAPAGQTPILRPAGCRPRRQEPLCCVARFAFAGTLPLEPPLRIVSVLP